MSGQDTVMELRNDRWGACHAATRAFVPPESVRPRAQQCSRFESVLRIPAARVLKSCRARGRALSAFGLLLVLAVLVACFCQPIAAAEKNAATNKNPLTTKKTAPVTHKTGSPTNSTAAKGTDRATAASNRLQPTNAAELWGGLGFLCMCLIFAFLAKSWPTALPGWLKWTCRILGALIIFSMLLPVAFTGLAIFLVIAGHTWTASNFSTVLGAIVGQLVGEVLLISLAVWLFRLSGKKASAAKQAAAADHLATPETAVISAAPRVSKAAAAKRWHSCNVLQVAPEAKHLWQFDARNGGFALNRQQTSVGGEALPSGLVSKDWRALFQPRLNVAWLPPENIFIRVAQFPHSEFKETLSMVELQLEKLSPLPVAQIVWTIHVLPHAAGNMQTVIVVIVARQVVEEFLGKLEGQGYLADRLELPVVDQLQATHVTGDGAWIYPEALGGKNTGLAAWWYGGVLQNVDLLHMPDANHPDALREQLTQMAWAGELEGWLTAPPRWHLVSTSGSAAQWETALRTAVDQPIEIVEPVPGPQLAALTARRATHADPQANLLPPEFSQRYHQQFVDRLWMRGLLAVGVLYLLGLAVYGTALGVAVYRTKGVENQAASISNEYTNTVKLREIYHVLEERNQLKYAGLDCWKAVAETLPETVKLETWNFSDGKKLALAGTVPQDAAGDLRKFEKAMRSNSLFTRGRGDELNYGSSGASGTYRWSFSLELNKGEGD